jgi:hypothetical protein
VKGNSHEFVKLLSQYLPGEIEEYHKKLVSIAETY